MQSHVKSERTILRKNMIHIDPPDSSKLVDLHVYIIPKQVWKNRQNLAENEAMERAVSAGFVRVPESLTIHDLRRYIIENCGEDNNFPREFNYLRSVGRCLTKVKQQQEKELKVKNYRPPRAFAPEIYILDSCRDNDSSISREPPMIRPSMDFQTCKKSGERQPLFNHNHQRQKSTFIPHSTFLTKLSPQKLLKLREEQQRLYLRQVELGRKRQELEDQQSQEEEDAAVKIQTAFRNYRDRHDAKQREQEDDTIENDHLQKETRNSTGRKAEYEHDVVRLSNRLEDLRAKRIELEANRELVVRRMKQLHAQITIQRKEEKDLWKRKYFIQKNQTAAFEKQNRIVSKNQTDIHTQLEQATIRLNNTTRLRQRAEYESRLLRHELQQISSNLNAIERYRLPKEPRHYQQHQKEPISVDISLQY